jgi:glutamine amidotransferase
MIVIVDYGMGNVGSIRNMFHRLGLESTITNNPAAIARADRLILPGVGAFDIGMRNLRACGLIPLLEMKVQQEHTPVLGICLGMQLLTLGSEEGQLCGLGWIEADTVRFRFADQIAPPKVPHMGWSRVRPEKDSPLSEGMSAEARFYFVHSYHVRCRHDEDIWLSCEYGVRFTAAVRRGNIVGVQFHPEKSHKFGMRLLDNFARAT